MEMRSLVFVAAFVAARAQNCNICGDGNSIQFPQGVVSFVYQGVMRKNNCKTWQDIVKNPNTISDSFCRNEMLTYTVDVCRCTTPSGALLAAIFVSPTASPAPGGPPKGQNPSSPASSPSGSSSSSLSSPSSPGSPSRMSSAHSPSSPSSPSGSTGATNSIAGSSSPRPSRPSNPEEDPASEGPPSREPGSDDDWEEAAHA